MTKTLRGVAAAAGLAALLAAGQAQAAIGDSLVATGAGNIFIRYEGTSASYDSQISVNGGDEFFPNKTTLVGTTLDLGFFATGTPLDIVLHVTTTGDFFRTGPASGNPDGVAHANVVYDYLGEAGRTYVGFEDILGGGDLNYGDHTFSLTNVQAAVPEPAGWLLLIAGLGAIGARRRRKPAA